MCPIWHLYKYRFCKETCIKQINEMSDKNNPAEFCCLAEKGHVEKESEVITQGMREVEVGTLARYDKKMLLLIKY